MFTISAHRLLVAMFALGSLLVVLAPPVSADYDSTNDRPVWKPIDGEVYALWQVGDRMFAGGDFTGVKRYLTAPETTDQPFLAAFDVDSGRIIDSFAPRFNGRVREIISSSDDSRIFVGGDFTSVNGLPNTARLVALDPITGAVDPNFLGNANGSVYDLEINGNDLYVGGRFSRVGTGFGGRVARLDATTGKRDTSFAPRPDYYVDAMDIPAEADRLYVAGTFDNINGRDGNQFVALDLETGDTITGFRTPYDQRVFDVLAHSGGVTAVYGGQPNAVAVFDRDGDLIRRHSDGNGDYQSLALNGSRTFVGGHSSITGGLSRPGFASMDSRTGSIDSLRIDVFAPRGVWDIYPSGGSLWLGGDIRQVDGANTGRMVRILREPGQVAPQTPASPTISTTLSSISFDWADSDAPNRPIREYRVIRSGKQIAVVGQSQFTDEHVVPGVRYAYNFEAIDFNGNVSARSATLVTSTLVDNQAPSVPGNVAVTDVGVSSVSLGWSASTDDYGPVRYQVERNGNVVATTSNLSFTDTGLPPQTTYTYTVRALDAFSNSSGAGTPALATTLPSSQPVPVELIGFGDTWKYNASGANLQRDWIALNYNDGAWPSGPTQIGFGDGDEATVISRSPWPSLTTYFRSTFDIADVAAVESMVLRVIRDDGVAVYVNGSEVGRDNLSSNANYDTEAREAVGPSIEDDPVSFGVNPSLLRTGSNTIAVEIHNSSYQSSDLSFDLELQANMVSTGNGDVERPTAPRSLTVSSAGPTLNLSWLAASDNVGVTGYRIYRDGAPLATVSGTTYRDTAVVTGTTYRYVVFANDAANNVSPASNTATGTPTGGDSQPAESTIGSLAPDEIVPLGPITFGGAATDNQSGVAHVYLTIRNRASLQWLQPNGQFADSFALLDTNLSAPGARSTNWTYPANLPLGEFAIETRAVDVQGNVESSRPWFKFTTSRAAGDVTAPEVGITSPTTDQVLSSGPVSLTGTVTDAGSGADRVRVSVQNSSTKEWLQNNGTFAAGFNLIDASLASRGSNSTTWSLAISLPPGDFAVEARGIDRLGNVQTPPTRAPFSVDG